VIVANVIQQHADDAAALAAARHLTTHAAYTTMDRLRRADHRLRAHLDGLKEAGEEASAFCEAQLEAPSSGAMFILAVDALEKFDQARLGQLVAIAHAVPEARSGLLSAFGWVERIQLQGTVATLLGDRDGFRRMLGIAICAIHRVDPGIVSRQYLRDPDNAVRARAFQAVGELGLRDLAPLCAATAQGGEDDEIRFWSAWSAALLGDHKSSLDLLTSRGLSSGNHRGRAFRLATQIMSATRSKAVLQSVASDPEQFRWLIQGSGIAGDPTYIPWLIKRMQDPATARLAGEAFTLITGADFGENALDRPAPEGFESGPNDNPDDPNVDMDPDDGLPWPDVEKIEQWWAANAARFQPGTRYFMGAPVTREHCINVLKNGYQRQRILAAHYLCLLEPGTTLFNTSAPAWRQQRLLAQMA